MKTVCETLCVARSNIAARAARSPSRARGRPPLPDRELVEDIKAIIADMPTYGYRRVTDNGSCFVARDTASLLRDIGMEPCTTPVRSPQSNGMAEAFVKTFKRDYVAVNPTPDAETVIAQLPLWFEHYNNLHPHSALGYQSPREFISSQSQA